MREEAGTGDPVIAVSVTRKLAGPGWSVFARKGFLAEWRHGRQVASIDLRGMATLPGAHNHQNACAAYAAARSLGLGPRQIEAALATYPGLPHRSQLVATWNGVRIVNDSKATNVDAAEKALLAFERVRWIAGGRPKEGGIAALRPLFGRVAKAYLIGEAAEDFAATLGETPHAVCGTLEAAVAAALAEAEDGRGGAAGAGLRQLRPVRELRGARARPSRRWSGRGSMAEARPEGIRAVYEAQAAGFDRTRNRRLVERALAGTLPGAGAGARALLDLGCGAGEPIARLSDRTRASRHRGGFRGGDAGHRAGAVSGGGMDARPTCAGSTSGGGSAASLPGTASST